MTKNISDEDLLAELKLRFEQNNKALSDLTVVNRKLLELNHRLQDSETLKSNFLSNIRNEINNPLNAIMGLASQIITITPGSAAAQCADTIMLEAQCLDFQLKNIFMAAELEAGDLAPEPARVAVCDLLQNVVNAHTPAAVQKQIQISTVCSGVLQEEFCTDADKLELITSNLLANAIEFSHQGDQVTLSAEAREGCLQLQIKDTGIGIDPKDFQRIFDRFVQLDSGSQRSHHGHGLGLSVVRSLLDLLGGSIGVQSSPESGTIFTVILPELQRDEGMMFADGGNLFLFDDSGEK